MTVWRGTALALWLALIPVGIWYGGVHDYTPGPGAFPSAPGTATRRPSGQASRYQLICFLHPYCPCSLATVEHCTELAERFPELDVTLVLACPPIPAEEREKGPIPDRLKRCSRVVIEWDRDMDKTHRYGARTSGQAFLIGPEGACRFQGGLTSARGRSGSSPGRRAVEACLRGEDPSSQQAAVYGCPLE